MRIAFFSESLLPHVDGVSLTLARLFGFLERAGVDFRVWAPFVPGPDVSWHGRVTGVPYVRFPLYPDYRVSLPTFRVSAALERFRPDVVHAVSPTPLAGRALRAAARGGVPAVASFHTHFVSYFRYYRVRPLEAVGWRLLRRFYRRCDAVYAPSLALVKELEARGIGRVRLWSRGVDAGTFSPAHRDEALRESVPGEGPILLYVGRLVREKDLADLADAARRLRERGLPFRLVLVGSGPLRDELSESLPWAHFAGHREGDELARWYASGDVFVFPSTTETFGNVVLEAMASGLPAVVVDRGGVTDLVRDGETGAVAPANEPAVLAARVEALLGAPQARRRMGRLARQEAQARDWDEVNAGLLDDYRRLARERSAP